MVKSNATPTGTRRSEMDVVHLSMRFAHHSAHSGYDRISAYMPEATVLRRLRIGPIWPIYRRLFRRFGSRRLPAHPYSAGNSLLELNGYRHYLLHRAKVYHHLYGDENFRHLRLAAAPVFATFHHTPEYLARFAIQGPYLKTLNGVIIVSEYQRRYFEQFVPDDRIHFVPHGIDTEFFVSAPAPAPPSGLRCLTVGSWLRDHHTMHEVTKAFLTQPELRDVSFEIVGHPSHRGHYDDCPNVSYVSGVSESELMSRYHRADLAVIPLADATANNALLEAMSCRLPVVISDVGGIRDYATDENVTFVPPRDPTALHDAIRALRDQPDRRRALAQAARRHVERFAWPRVADRMREVYNTAAHLARG